MDQYPVDYINQRYNELTIKKFIARPNTDKYKSWNTSKWVECKCSCGQKIMAPLYGVINGKIKSCGHLKSEQGTMNLEEYRKNNPPANSVFLTCNGETKNISQWSEDTGIPRTTIMARMDKGLTAEKVLEKKQ